MRGPFGETAEHILAATGDDDLAFFVLADHLDEAGLGDLARIIREREWDAFRLIHEFLSGSRFDPSKMRLAVMTRRVGGFPVDPRWISYRTFWTRRRFAGIRVAFYRANPTPSFLDPFATDPAPPLGGRR